MLFFFVSCTTKVKTIGTEASIKKDTLKSAKHTVKCKNDASLYAEVVKDVLYKDSLSNIYLKRKQTILDSPLGGELTECEKLPFAFIKEVGTLDDGIKLIKDVVDIDSFKTFKSTDTYFLDDKKIYVYRDYPIGYPPFYELSLKQNEIVIIDSLYIKDVTRVYWKGIKIKNADAKSFKSSFIRAQNGKKQALVHDKNYIYFNGKPYTLERLKHLSAKKNVIDSLIQIYF